MYENIKSIPGLINEKIPTIDKQIRQLFSHHELLNIKEILLTGCGDSYFASEAAKYAFQRFAGIRTYALPSMEAGRYYLIDNKSSFVKNPMVIAISVSGEVSRTVEALKIAKGTECFTVAITGNPNSKLAEFADRIIDGSLPPSKNHSPGVASFRMSMLILLLFSIHLAEVRGKILMSFGDKLRKELLDISEYVNETIESCSPIADELAKVFMKDGYFVFVSDGPGKSTADFSAAKLIEATGLIGLSQETEEWCHLQYFDDIDEGPPSFLICSGKRGLNRVKEVIKVMKRVNRNVILVSTKLEASNIQGFDHFLPICGDVRDEFRPLIDAVACELFAASLSEKLNRNYFRQGKKNFKIGNGIRESEIMEFRDLFS